MVNSQNKIRFYYGSYSHISVQPNFFDKSLLGKHQLYKSCQVAYQKRTSMLTTTRKDIECPLHNDRKKMSAMWKNLCGTPNSSKRKKKKVILNSKLNENSGLAIFLNQGKNPQTFLQFLSAHGWPKVQEYMRWPLKSLIRQLASHVC